MAARIRKSHQASVIEKIRASQLINRLQKYALADGLDAAGIYGMQPAQVQAVRILLGKCLPDLSSVDSRVTGNVIVNIVD